MKSKGTMLQEPREGNMQGARKQQRRFHLELSPIRRGRIADQHHSGLALSAYGRVSPEPAPCASPGGRRRWGCSDVREAEHTVRPPRTYCRCLRAPTPPVSAVQPAHRPRCGGARKRRVRQTAAAASAPPRSMRVRIWGVFHVGFSHNTKQCAPAGVPQLMCPTSALLSFHTLLFFGVKSVTPCQPPARGQA